MCASPSGRARQIPFLKATAVIIVTTFSAHRQERLGLLLHEFVRFYVQRQLELTRDSAADRKGRLHNAIPAHGKRDWIILIHELVRFTFKDS